MADNAFARVEVDIKKADQYLRSLGIESEYIERNMLRGIGNAVKNQLKKVAGNYFRFPTGATKKSIKSKLKSKRHMVVVSTDQTNPANGVRYPWVLTAGATMRAEGRKVMRFQIDGKWISKHEVTIKKRNFIYGPAMDWMKTPAYERTLDKLLDKEIKRWEKQQAAQGGTK